MDRRRHLSKDNAAYNDEKENVSSSEEDENEFRERNETKKIAKDLQNSVKKNEWSEKKNDSRNISKSKGEDLHQWKMQQSNISSKTAVSVLPFDPAFNLRRENALDGMTSDRIVGNESLISGTEGGEMSYPMPKSDIYRTVHHLENTNNASDCPNPKDSNLCVKTGKSLNSVNDYDPQEGTSSTRSSASSRTDFQISEQMQIQQRSSEEDSDECNAGKLYIAENENTSTVNIQVAIQGENKSFICQKCGKSFSLKKNLGLHLKVHTEEKPFVCQHCGKGFIYESYLKKHLRIHGDEKPFKCDQCPKAFKQKPGLYIHLKVHSDKRPYACNECLKKFKTVSELKSHNLIHTSEKPFKCDTCQKSFKRLQQLKRHINKKSFVCVTCGRKFCTSLDLARHENTVHNNLG